MRPPAFFLHFFLLLHPPSALGILPKVCSALTWSQTPQQGGLGLLGALGCHLAVRSGTQGFTGAMAGYLGGRSGASSEPSRLLIHTFPLSLRQLPLAAIQQVVAVAGLAVAAVLQHLRVAFDVDEPLGLQFMKRSPRCGFRTSAGIGYSPDPRLTGIPASGTAGAWQREMFRRGVSAKEAVLPFRKEELPLFCVFLGSLPNSAAQEFFERAEFPVKTKKSAPIDG